MKTKTSSNHPAWAIAHKRSVTEFRLIRGNYYLYEYKTVYIKPKRGPEKSLDTSWGLLLKKKASFPLPKGIWRKQ